MEERGCYNNAGLDFDWFIALLAYLPCLWRERETRQPMPRRTSLILPVSIPCFRLLPPPSSITWPNGITHNYQTKLNINNDHNRFLSFMLAPHATLHSPNDIYPLTSKRHYWLLRCVRPRKELWCFPTKTGNPFRTRQAVADWLNCGWHASLNIIPQPHAKQIQ